MKVALMALCLFFSTALFAQDCVKNLRGETVCRNGSTAAAVNPNTGNAAVAHTNSNGVTTTQTSNGGEAKTKNGAGAAVSGNGNTAAMKTQRGNSAVAQKNSNGVTTTQTTLAARPRPRTGRVSLRAPMALLAPWARTIKAARSNWKYANAYSAVSGVPTLTSQKARR